ncbi:MAG TPA: 3-hydroxyacyl-CoA dehydrogenase NAD-binding domain-containing protein [Candidatus Didemnitutus sp.]|nr:3-hydroxyacyl-CoA dehydrogenase NAD-binding domain-containing protein [Candidatus Didemnitutus sp.]
MSTAVNQSVDGDGIGWIVLGGADQRVNVINPEWQAALRAALEDLATKSIRAVVIIGAHDDIFVAGADLRWLSTLADATAGAEAARQGRQLFGSLTRYTVPVVCAIHGACAGGGYEMAVACAWRIASDAKQTKIGLPEVGLGLLPGWGGTVRLTRLIGANAAATQILRAQLIPSAKALAAGLIDEVVPAAQLREQARAAALRLAAGGLPARTPPPHGEAVTTKSTTRVTQGVLEVIAQTVSGDLDAAFELEARYFGELVASPTARNTIHAFFLRERLKKTSVDPWLPPVAGEAPVPAPLRRIGIVGAGVMGSGIAHWCAARGLGVLMNDVDTIALKQGVQMVRELFHDDERRGLTTGAAAHKAIGGIGITTDLRDFEDCEIVIEAVAENVAVKRKVFADLSKYLGPDCIFASNSSAIPIEEMTAGIAHPGRAIGLHFFNPVSRMPLVEIILGPQTDRETARRVLAFVQSFGKLPVVCKSSPGLFVTRVLFSYLNEACRLWEQGVATEALDAAMRDWGWPMGPLRLIDEVGVDITDFIFAELGQYFPGRFIATTLCRRMLSAGLRGRKNGTSAGFYVYGDGEPRVNPAVAALAASAPMSMDAATIQAELTRVLIDETQRTLNEGIVKTPDEADAALLVGAGFPAARGGLMRFARSSGYAGS